MSHTTIASERPAKKTYFTRTHYAEAEFSLDDFSDDEIIDYVRETGLMTDITASIGDLSTLDTLLICGQREAALEVIGKALTISLGRHVRL